MTELASAREETVRVELAEEWGYDVAFRDGLIRTVRMHTDPAAALAGIDAVAEG